MEKSWNQFQLKANGPTSNHIISLIIFDMPIFAKKPVPTLNGVQNGNKLNKSIKIHVQTE